MSTFIQRSFSGGELSPSLYARTDVGKYQTGLRTCRNAIIQKHGGATNRPGTKFIAEVKDHSKTVRLVPFVFSTTQTYVLEFGDLYMRVIHSGDHVRLTAQNITAITNANPCVVTYSGSDTYANGDQVYISGVVGDIANYINGRTFKVANVDTGANTFELNYLDSTAVNSTSWGSYTSGGTVEEIYEISTPYVEADLPELRFVQSGDVVTIVHPTYAPYELSRTDHDSWTLEAITFDADIVQLNTVSATSGGAGANTYRYQVTKIKAETYTESLPNRYETKKTISNITQANPAVVTTTTNHGYVNGDIVYITKVGGMVEVNNLEFTVAGVTATTFQLSGIDSTSYTAYTGLPAGEVKRFEVKLSSAAAPSASAPHVLSWTHDPAAVEYNVYKESNGVYGFIGTAAPTYGATTVTYSDTGTAADTTASPPKELNYFEAAGDYPSCVTYYPQRLIFGATDNDPEKVFCSGIGAFKTFSSRFPTQDDDAITFQLAGRQVNRVKHLVDVGTLILFTESGEFAALGGSAGILLPGEINTKQYSYNGANSLTPIVIGNSALYVQARGSIVRDLGFKVESDGYSGDDLTVFSTHLFEGYELTDWAFQKVPNSNLWVVRDDGKFLCLTYVKEHGVLAWSQGDFGDDLVENVVVIPGTGEDNVYFVVKRTINGATKRYIEKLATRQVVDIVDSTFLDAYLSYDGRNTNTSHTMTLSGGTNWTYDETLTLTSSTSYFSASEVGNSIFINGLDDDGDEITLRCEITAYTSATVVSVQANRTVPSTLRSTATSDWARAVDQVTGLWHLEGKDVSVFADGYVVASPNNASNTIKSVTNGVLTLDRAYSVIHVGLPYISDIQTLDIDSPQGESITDKFKRISKVTIHVEKTRGLWVGPAAPSDDTVDPLEALYEPKIRSSEGYDSPVSLITDKIDVLVRPEWNSNGRVFIRQVDPLPMTILAIAPEGQFPFRGG